MHSAFQPTGNYLALCNWQLGKGKINQYSCMSFSVFFKITLIDAEMPFLCTQRYTGLVLKSSADFFCLFDFPNALAFVL